MQSHPTQGGVCRRIAYLSLAAASALLVSPAVRADDKPEIQDLLIQLVKRARIIDLSHTWEIKSPIAGVNPPYSFALSATHANTRGTFGDGGQLSFTSEVMDWSGQHGAPSIDAIAHIGRDGKLFGGVDAAAATSNPDGVGASGVGAHLAIDKFPNDLLVSRAVLLDVARWKNGNATPLAPGYEITAKDLDQTAQHFKVRIRRGDTVLIRTGWGPYFKSNAGLYAGPDSPGPGVEAADWLIKHGARIVGNDTLTFEKRPPITLTPKFQVFPVHMRLIADSGIYIIENLDLEALANARAYHFAAVIPPLKVKGGTGSALRAFAITAPDD
ncbi:MAG: cyclase family protein [Burkholderiales bacterium]